MDSYTRDRVATIAASVRSKIQARADRDEERLRGDTTVSDLNGWCAIASASLFAALKRAGIAATIKLFRGGFGSHVFLEVDDHVVDITATQFREFRSQEVVILHSREAQVYEFYNPEHEFFSPESLRKHQQKVGWPRDQIAYVC